MISHKYKSPNFNERDPFCRLEYIIIHYTGVKSPFSDICKWFEKPSSAVSCHYAIDYDGTIYSLSLIHISEPTRQAESRMPSSA